MSDSSENHTAPPSGEACCFFCGTLPAGSTLIDGKMGPICSTCIYSLGARLAELERDGAQTNTAAQEGVKSSDHLLGEDGELSVHDYQNRADLALAYIELGKTHLAVEELFLALESALICEDWAFALRVVKRIRDAVDGPTVRDRIHDMLSRHVPED